MAINVTLGKAKTHTEKPFPKLMIGNCNGPWENLIVLFYKKNIGSILNGVNIGAHANNFNMEWFDEYNEPITLQNA